MDAVPLMVRMVRMVHMHHMDARGLAVSRGLTKSAVAKRDIESVFPAARMEGEGGGGEGGVN